MWYCLYFYVCVYDVSTDNGNNMMDTIYLLYPCTYIYTIIHYCVFMHTYIQYVYMYVCQYVLQFHASVKMDMYVYCNTGKYNHPCLMDSTSTVVSHLIVRSQMTLLCTVCISPFVSLFA